jgi:DNA polymerase-4
MQKPDGLVAIMPEEIPQKLYPMKLGDLPGIGRGMSRRLERYGIKTVEQLCSLPMKKLQEIWESKVMADIWWAQIHGHDLPARPTQRRSVSHSHVLAPKYRNDHGAKSVMARMIHKAATRMRTLGYWAHHMQMTVKHTDAPKWTIKTDLGGTNDTLSMMRKLSELWPQRHIGVPVQVIVVLYDMVPGNSIAPSLFEEPRKHAQLAQAMDNIDKKYGRHAVFHGAMFGAQDSAPTRISFTQVPKETDWD